MSLPDLSTTELKKYFNEQDFVEATALQINKDLVGLFHAEYSVAFNPDSTKLETLIDTLAPILQELSKKQPEYLAQFIYRVDLHEKKFMDSVSKDISLKHLSFLIIEREAQKIYLRKRFS